jgi:hypothetical protein
MAVQTVTYHSDPFTKVRVRNQGFGELVDAVSGLSAVECHDAACALHVHGVQGGIGQFFRTGIIQT